MMARHHCISQQARHTMMPQSNYSYIKVQQSQSIQLTIMGMRHPEEPVALQAIEFWSTVCDEEIELDIEASEVSRSLRASC